MFNIFFNHKKNIFLCYSLKKQWRKRPEICIKCNKRGNFGERKRKREREKDIVLGYYTIVKIKRERESNK